MKVLPLLLLCLLLTNCSVGKKSTTPKNQTFVQQELGLAIVQDSKTISVQQPRQTVVLRRKPFTLQFNGKEYKAQTNEWYSVQIAALDSKALTDIIAEGAVCFDIDYFMPGSGMATLDEYPTLTVSPDAHHYITYETNGEQRAKLISKNEDLLRLSWEVKTVTYNDIEMPLEKLSLNPVYLVVLSDFNLNKTIDKGEFAVVTLNFE